MHRNVLPTLPNLAPSLSKLSKYQSTAVSKQISVREHDYSIKITKKFPDVGTKPSKCATFKSKSNNEKKITSEIAIDGDEIYELKELCIEPLVTNVVKVLDVIFSTNIPLEDICHSHVMLEITPIVDSTFQEELCKVSYLNESCKVCLKDLTSTEKIPFFDDCGDVNTEITNISTALQAMNVEVTRDDQLPQQICIECYNIFSKMSIFKQICKRSKKALEDIREFTAKQLTSVKVEDDNDVLCDASSEIIEIKEEIEEIDHLVDQQMIVDEEIIQNPFLMSTQTDTEGNLPEKILPSTDLFNLRTANNQTLFQCGKCTKAFPTRFKYNRHQLLHQTLVCDFCGHVCYSKRSIQEHLKSHVVGLYPCPFCDQRFGSRKRVGIHRRAVHQNELYKCPHCSKEYKLKDTFRCHLLKHSADKPHKCTYCEKQFVFRHHWENHLRTHTKAKPFLCNFCGKTFRAEVALRTHLSTHDPKMYPQHPHRRRHPKIIRHCDMCNYSTEEPGNMKKHKLNFHGGRSSTGKFEFVCHICDKEFRQAASLDNHLETHNEVRDFHCTYCKASFKKPHYLKLHIDGVHLKKRPNKCDQCPAAYLISNDLKRHKLQKHSKDRPFECFYCQKKFVMALYLKTHINRIHSKEKTDLE